MSNQEPLPEFYLTDDRQRISRPTYEALAQCQIIMVGENNIPGPTLVEPGEVFTTDAVPNHQWFPLNRAAGERYDAWIAALPASGAGLSQAEITEAAYMMRPREGEPEIPHDQWWGAVMKLAATMKDKRQGNAPRVPQPAQRQGGQRATVMPFVSHGTTMPGNVGQPGPQDAPQRVATGDAGTRRVRPAAKPASPLSNSNPSDSVAQTAGT